MTLRIPRQPTTALLAVLFLAACGGGGEQAAESPPSPGASAGEGGVALQLALHDMHCTGCAETIATALRGGAGVVLDTVSFADSLAIVRYDAAQTSPETIIGLVEGVGYRATPQAAP
jgi:copper chaperone CopZ